MVLFSTIVWPQRNGLLLRARTHPNTQTKHLVQQLTILSLQYLTVYMCTLCNLPRARPCLLCSFVFCLRCHLVSLCVSASWHCACACAGRWFVLHRAAEHTRSILAVLCCAHLKVTSNSRYTQHTNTCIPCISTRVLPCSLSMVIRSLVLTFVAFSLLFSLTHSTLVTLYCAHLKPQHLSLPNSFSTHPSISQLRWKFNRLALFH